MQLALLILCISISLARKNQCPNGIKTCVCKQNEKQAFCRELSYIPEFPDYVSTIQLVKNHFPTLTRNFVYNLTKINLKGLLLFSNKIQEIDNDTFVDLKNLTHFELSQEKNTSTAAVGNALAGMTCRLLIVHFQRNDWKSIPATIFAYYAMKSVTKLYLSDNKLEKFSFRALTDLKQLTELILANNNIKMLRLDRAVSIRTLDMSNNDIVFVYSFCLNKAKNVSCCPRLRSLNLNTNSISTLTPEMFRCLPNLLKLELGDNKFTTIPQNLLMFLPKIETLIIRNMRVPNSIERFAFNSTSLLRLRLNKNRFHLMEHKRFDLVNIFRDIPNLLELDLSENFLPDTHKEINLLFGPIKDLSILNLHAAAIFSLPVDFVRRFKSMNTLNFQGNYIKRIFEGTFENMTSLRELNFNGNNLHLINESSFPLDVLSSLSRLDLSNNPFSCTCDQMWFRDWIRNRNKTIKLVNFPHRYKCLYPESLRGMPLKKYNPTVESCTPWNPLYTMAICLVSFAVLVVLVIFSVYHCNENIRNFFYLMRLNKMKRKGYIKLDNREDFEYHAFVVYCIEDREWVHNVFLPKLDEQCIRLCIHMRDFEAGEAVTDNVEKYLQKSWKVVVVMSNSFAKSEWCQWETDFIQERRRRQGKEALVLIMLKTIDSNHMTSSIRAMLKTTPYLTYTKGIGEDLFWKSVIGSIRRPLSNPPIAV